MVATINGVVMDTVAEEEVMCDRCGGTLKDGYGVGNGYFAVGDYHCFGSEIIGNFWIWDKIGLGRGWKTTDNG